MFSAQKIIFNPLLVLIVSLSLLPFQILAKQEEEDIGTDQGADFPDAVDEWKFKEGTVKFPAYPETASLLKIDIDAGSSPFEYLLDASSLSTGIDGVVLYTIVIQSSTGGRNILFEGLRCDTGEYKTHAYGTGKKTFFPMSAPEWKYIGDKNNTGMDYRYDLLKTYFCDGHRSMLDKAEILRRVEYPDNLPAYGIPD